ncbi:MAG: SDR family oxidoreductase [Lachnospiraceae bacterium]|nr:SDR family oxidoreductase [Lachnospiraceae bacterium]
MNLDYVKEVFSLEGRQAVVTGASSGIGRGIAVSLANLGAHVALLGRNQEGLDETERQIREKGGSCESYQVDITVEDQVEEFFQKHQDLHGQMDIFVANAGINYRAELLETEMEAVDRIINTDFKGTLYGVIRAGRIMKKQKSGNIVVITSINGISAMGNLAVYSSIKYAQEGLVKALASSLGPYGVRVNSCAPGVILSNMNRNVYGEEENLKAKLKSIPLGRIGQPRDIGDVVACMVSDGFRFMTGTTVLVDGGELMRGMQKQD